MICYIIHIGAYLYPIQYDQHMYDIQRVCSTHRRILLTSDSLDNRFRTPVLTGSVRKDVPKLYQRLRSTKSSYRQHSPVD